ncbi:MAG: right-handed parallel beta-helix repeat-containing protein [Planctomycetota bacterium]
MTPVIAVLVEVCPRPGNTATDHGGGIRCYDGNPTITNCTITGNTAGRSAGGIRCDYSDPTITNCTIAGNTATEGGGIVCYQSSGPTITNCVFWGDAPQEISVSSSSTLAMTYCDVQGGWTGDGNIDADPLFVDPDGPDGDPATWEDNDYHLAANSPCIDAGDPASDYSFEPEPDGGRVNMGAYGNTSEAATKGWLCIEDYEVVSRTRVGRTLFDYELSIVIANESDTAATGVFAELLSAPGSATIIDGEVDVGGLAAGETVISVDTFTLRVDRSALLSPLPISWQVTYSQGGMTRESAFTKVLLPKVFEPSDEPGGPDDPTGLDGARPNTLSEAPRDAAAGSVPAVGTKRDSRTSAR